MSAGTAKHIRTGINNSYSITVGEDGTFYAVGFRNANYGKNEWCVRFSPFEDHAVRYAELERHHYLYAGGPLDHTVQMKVWEIRLKEGRVVATKEIEKVSLKPMQPGESIL